MDSAYTHNVGEDVEGVIFQLVLQDLFDRAVEAKRIETEDSTETVQTELIGTF